MKFITISTLSLAIPLIFAQNTDGSRDYYNDIDRNVIVRNILSLRPSSLDRRTLTPRWILENALDDLSERYYEAIVACISTRTPGGKENKEPLTVPLGDTITVKGGHYWIETTTLSTLWQLERLVAKNYQKPPAQIVLLSEEGTPITGKYKTLQELGISEGMELGVQQSTMDIPFANGANVPGLRRRSRY